MIRPLRERDPLGLRGDTPGYAPRQYAFYDYDAMLALNDLYCAGGCCEACDRELGRQIDRMAGTWLVCRRFDAEAALAALIAAYATPEVRDDETGDTYAAHVRPAERAPTAARPLAVTLTVAPAAPPSRLAA